MSHSIHIQDESFQTILFLAAIHVITIVVVTNKYYSAVQYKNLWEHIAMKYKITTTTRSPTLQSDVRLNINYYLRTPLLYLFYITIGPVTRTACILT